MLEVVLATGPSGGFPRACERGQEDGRENADDGDDDQKFDKGEAASKARPMEKKLHKTS